MERTSLPLFAFNVGAVQFWRSAARPFGARSWRGAMERFAAQHGRAICHRADDSALIVERSYFMDKSLRADSFAIVERAA